MGSTEDSGSQQRVISLTVDIVLTVQLQISDDTKQSIQ